MSALESHDPLVLNLRDGSVWTRRAVDSDGRGQYALAGVCDCPEYVLASFAELAERGITGHADVLPVPAGPEPSELEGLRAAYVTALDNAARTHPCPVLGDRYWSGCVHYDEAGRVSGVGSCHSERRADAVLAVRDAEVERLRELLREATAGAAVADDLTAEWRRRAESAEAQVAELEAQRERRRARLVALQNDALSMRGSLSPAGGDRKVPFPLGETLTPAVDWLIGRVAELEALRADRRVEFAVQYPDGQTVMAETITFERSKAEASLRAHRGLNPMWNGCRIVQRSVSWGEWVEAPADAVTAVFAPVASLREPEGEFHAFLHHDNRLGHDMPETGGGS